MEAILHALGFKPHNGRAACLLHGGDNPTAFSYTDEVWFCFACGSKGDKIDLVMEATGLDKITLASKDNVPDGLTFSDLDVYDGELKDYLKADSYKLTIKLFLDEDLEESMKIRAKLKYKITVGI